MGLLPKSLFWLAIVLAISHAESAMRAVGGVHTADSGSFTSDTSGDNIQGTDISSLYAIGCKTPNSTLQYEIVEIHPEAECYTFDEFNGVLAGNDLIQGTTFTSTDIGVPRNGQFGVAFISVKQTDNQGRFKVKWNCRASSSSDTTCSLNYVNQLAGKVESNKFNQHECSIYVFQNEPCGKYPLAFETTMARECNVFSNEECPTVTMVETKDNFMRAASKMGQLKWARYDTWSTNNVIVITKQVPAYSDTPNNYMFEWNEITNGTASTDTPEPPASTTTPTTTTTTTTPTTTTSTTTTTTTTTTPTTTTTTTTPTTTTSTSTTTTTPVPTPQPDLINQCGGKFSLSGGKTSKLSWMTDGSYYENNQNCAWLVQSDEDATLVCLTAEQLEKGYDGFYIVYVDVNNAIVYIKLTSSYFNSCFTINASHFVLVFGSDGSVRSHGCDITFTPTGGNVINKDAGRDIQWVNPNATIGSVYVPGSQLSSAPSGTHTSFFVSRDLSKSIRGKINCNPDNGDVCNCAALPRYVSTAAPDTNFASWPGSADNTDINFDTRECLFCSYIRPNTAAITEGCEISWEAY
ncbi:unnamed protein product [Allacma fusca]|uniref:Uncharacterized protein n=1 Tax=Allacma fusca TaxID=39272 RepID=A0A8J2JNP1_9HEXA|nr:unnamed protein product [Allacma fusca]